MADKKVVWVKKNPIFDIFGDNSAVALWTFDGTLDERIHQYDLSVYSTLDQPTYISGKKFKAVSGTNTGFTTSAGTFVFSNNNYTISAWVRVVPNADVSGYFRAIVAQGTEANYGIMLGIEQSLDLKITDGHASVVDTDIDLNSNWQHIIVSSDGANGAKTYLNGQWVKDLGTLDSNTDSNNNTNSTLVKSYRNNALDWTGPFPGDIDHLRVFNRAVTAQEALTLYNEIS